MKKRNPFITQAALIAALYVVLTLVSAAFGLDSKAIQFRLSEVLTVLPALTPAAIPGLFIGCLLSNFICGAMLPDMIFGSLATLIGAVGTYFIGKRVKWLSALPPIAANTVIVPLVLKYAYHLDGTVPVLCAYGVHRRIRLLRHPRHCAALCDTQKAGGSDEIKHCRFFSFY